MPTVAATGKRQITQAVLPLYTAHCECSADAFRAYVEEEKYEGNNALLCTLQ